MLLSKLVAMIHKLKNPPKNAEIEDARKRVELLELRVEVHEREPK